MPDSTTSEYAHQIVGGKIPSGKWVRLAAERHLADLGREDFAYRFDADKAARAIEFIEMLPHTKGRWAAKGELITLELWQCFIVGSLFGWVRKSDGVRRFREAYIEIARKNGKSLLAAAIGLYMLVADNEFAAEVFSGATTEKQAWEIFRPARTMAKKSPELLDHYGLEVNASNLLRVEDYSKFEPIIGNPGDGASPSCVLVDEYHEHKSPDLYDTMQTGMGAREQPLIIAITTAGNNLGGPCYDKRLEGQKVLEGVFDDDRLFVLIYALDIEDDYTDPELWVKANPNIDVSVSRDYLTAQVGGAVRNPSRQNAVRTKHFNIWVGAKTAWLSMGKWAKAADPLLALEDFAADPCYSGLDLSTKLDLTARVDLFTRDIEGATHYYAIPTFYLPEEAVEAAKNSKIYQGWATAGHIEVMEGAEIDFAKVGDDILALSPTHRLKELVYDPWQATQLAQGLRAGGIEAVELPNTVKNISPAMRELEAAIAAGRFHHNDNPVFNWNAANIVAREDAKNNIFPRKDTPESKIDGIVALLFAIARAMYAGGNTHAYQDRGFTTL